MGTDLETNVRASREEAAAILADVASAVRSGTLRIHHDDEAMRVEVPDDLDVEIEFETDEEEVSVEIELEWPATTGEGDSTLEPIADPSIESSDMLVEPIEPIESLADFEVFLDKSDEWRWRLVHRNGNIIATSGEGYTRKENAYKGLHSVVRNSPEADVTDESLTG